MRFFFKAKPSPTAPPPAPAVSRPRPLLLPHRRPVAIQRLPERAGAGLTELDMATLSGVAVITTLERGQVLPCPEAGREHVAIVVDGMLAVAMPQADRLLELTTVSKGDCFDAGPGAGYTVVARETSRVMALPPAVLELVPPATRLAVDRWTAACAAARFAGLAARHAALAARGEEIVAQALAVDERTRAGLAAPGLHELIAGIPRLPLYASDLAFRLLDERAHADDIVESIRHNPALAALVLKRVNSAAYGRATQVADYYQAFLLLGVNAVYQLVLESGVESVMPDTEDSREIMAHSHLVSVLAREIAVLAGGVPPLVAGTIGLLHDIGRTVVVLLRHTQPAVAGVVDLLEPSVVGGAVLASWGLPERVVRVVERQRHPELLAPDRLEPAFARETAVLHLAHACAQWLAGGATTAPYSAEYLAFLGRRESDAVEWFRDAVVPAARKNVEALPTAVRALLDGNAASARARRSAVAVA